MYSSPVSLAPTITPDFTGLLPPPPPSSHLTSSRPPPNLLSLSPLNIPSPRSVSPQQSPRQSPQVSLPSPQNVPYKAPPPPYKSPPYYPQPPEASPSTRKQDQPSPQPPPYPTQSHPAKLPSYSLEELKDLPGANLKKSTVDLTTYISAMAQNKHPNFENVDSFAERCLACIVRKIKSNLPTLKALLDSSLAWRGDCPDNGK